MFKHVLIAYDESQAAQRALATGVGVASQTGGRLTVAHVASPPVEEALDDAQAIAMEPRVAIGWPGEEILRLTREIGADLVVTGARRIGGLGAIVRDAVPDRLLLDATCTVLVVGEEEVPPDAASVIAAATQEGVETASPIAVLARDRRPLQNWALRADARDALSSGAAAVLALPPGRTAVARSVSRGGHGRLDGVGASRIAKAQRGHDRPLVGASRT